MSKSQGIYSYCSYIMLLSTYVQCAEMSTQAETSNRNDTWWHNAVIYQINPSTFMDSNGDGTGDLKGIIMQLPYLAETGISIICLGPIYQSPMLDAGYDIVDHMILAAQFGEPRDFEDLIRKADGLGIKIILDFVPNHTSNQHAWFQHSIERAEGYEHFADFYVWDDGKLDENGARIPPNNWRAVFGGPAWTWNESRQQFYLHQFAPELPDLNHRNRMTRVFMQDILSYWLDKGVAGFRVCAANQLYETRALTDEPLSGKTADPNSYDYLQHIHTQNLEESCEALREYRQHVELYNHTTGGPMRIIISAAAADAKPTVDYYMSSFGLRGAHLALNFGLITELDANSDARDFVLQIQKWLIYMPHGYVPNWMLGSHDYPRIASRFDARMVDTWNMLLLTLPGVAVTYYGEELGMQDYRDMSFERTLDLAALHAGPNHYKQVSRDPQRTPFQWNDTTHAGFSTAEQTWLPVHPNYKQINLAQQQSAKRSHYKVYKRLVELRKLRVLRKGQFQVVPLSRQVFYLRRDLEDHSSILTVINVSAERVSVNLLDIHHDTRKLRVLVASSISQKYNSGHDIYGDRALFLDAYEGIVGELFTWN